jgi:hypothetical protein
MDQQYDQRFCAAVKEYTHAHPTDGIGGTGARRDSGCSTQRALRAVAED